VTLVTAVVFPYSHNNPMIDSVSLTAGTRQVLQYQQRTAALTEQAINKISTGRKVNSAIDSPTAFFQAQGLSNRASDLLAVKDQIGQSLHTIETASIGLEAINSTIDQLRSIATSAKGGSTTERQAAAQLFDSVASQLDAFASDSSYSGINLIRGSPQVLEAAINDKGDTLSISGAAADSAGLGIGSAVADYGNFASAANIDAALAKLDTAAATSRARERAFSTDVSILSIREQFSTNLSDTLKVGSDKLLNADLEKQAANLLSLQVRQKLGNISLNLISENLNSIAKLF